MNTNTSPIQRDEWYKQEREESTLIIQTFTSIIEQNTNTCEKNERMIKTAGTYISVYTKIESIFKTYRFLILTPFDKKKVPRIENPQTEYDYDHPIYPYTEKDSNLFMKDFYFYADKSFYNWMYSELFQSTGLKGPILISIGEDKMSCQIGKNNMIIDVLSYNDNYNTDNKIDFEEWYKNSDFTMSFELQILNPHTYSFPFHCKPYKYKYTPKGTNYLDFVPSHSYN
jgi:hypothetical protein